ncbi:MAG: hypothetical protein AB2L20_27615 [Mangrovibacterium sp.]
MKGSNILGRLKKKFSGDETQKVFGWISVGKFRCGGTEAIKNFLIDFQGVALISERAIEKELLLKSLVRLNLPKLIFPRKLRIALRHGHEVANAKLFVDFLLHYNF